MNDYSYWHCIFCGAACTSRMTLKRHLRSGLCAQILKAKQSGHMRGFLRQCTCKGGLLWPQPGWYRNPRIVPLDGGGFYTLPGKELGS